MNEKGEPRKVITNTNPINIGSWIQKIYQEEGNIEKIFTIYLPNGVGTLDSIIVHRAWKNTNGEWESETFNEALDNLVRPPNPYRLKR